MSDTNNDTDTEIKTDGDAAASAPAPQTSMAHYFGEMVWLLSQSPQHKHLFLSDMEWAVMPAFLHRQFKVYRGPDGRGGQRPIAVAVWAFVNDEAETRLSDGQTRLRPTDWKSGDTAWLVELVTPFGGAEEALKDLKASVFKGKNFKYHRTKDGKREVVEDKGE